MHYYVLKSGNRYVVDAHGEIRLSLFLNEDISRAKKFMDKKEADKYKERIDFKDFLSIEVVEMEYNYAI